MEFTGDWPTTDTDNISHFNDLHSRLTTHDLDFPDADGEAPAFEEAGGAAYLASKVLELKSLRPQSLVLDAGDISEGNPLGDLRGNGGIIDFFEELDTQLKAQSGNSSGRGCDGRCGGGRGGGMGGGAVAVAVVVVWAAGAAGAAAAVGAVAEAVVAEAVVAAKPTTTPETAARLAATVQGRRTVAVTQSA